MSSDELNNCECKNIECSIREIPSVESSLLKDNPRDVISKLAERQKKEVQALYDRRIKGLDSDESSNSISSIYSDKQCACINCPLKNLCK